MFETVNKRIKSVREERGYTQEDVANYLHISTEEYSKWKMKKILKEVLF